MLAPHTLAVSLVLLGSYAATLQAQEKSVRLKITERQIDFLVGDELVSSYRTKDFAKPIFWPVNAPGGVPLTRAWPMVGQKGGATDHIHQKSAWFCHGDVIPEGIELKEKIRGVKGVDFWSEAKGHGKMVCTKIGTPKSHGDGVHLPTHNEWRTADGTKIMDEDRIVRLYD